MSEIENDLKRNVISIDTAERLFKLKRSIIEDKRKEMFTKDPKTCVSKSTMAIAAKMSMCVENPKRTLDEWLNVPEHEFNQVNAMMEQFLNRNLVPLNFAIDLAIESLSSWNQETIPIKTVLEVLNNARRGDLKKNLETSVSKAEVPIFQSNADK